MKTLTLQCKECRKIITLSGNDIDEIIHKIDNSQWRDMPSPNGYLEALCPTCDALTDDAELSIPE